MKDKLLIVFVCVVSWLFNACQRGESEYDTSPRANLNALWTIIDQHYCFIDYKEKELDINWANIRSEYEAKPNPKMTRAQLFEVLVQMLSRLQDGHVNLASSLDLGRNWSWREDYPLNLSTDVREKYLGSDYRLSSGLKYRILEDNIAYVVYESFSSPIGNGNLDDMFLYFRLCDGLILDIRGNSGGELTNCDRLSSRFTNEKVLVGYSAHKTGPGHNDFSKPVPEYVEPSTNVRWQKPVVVLTNRSCYSASNTFVRNMKEMPLVTVMGDQTGGGSGMPFSSELPVGWSVRFSACPSYDARMEQTEFGIQPDVSVSLDESLVPQGIDSMIEEARRFLKSL